MELVFGFFDASWTSRDAYKIKMLSDLVGKKQITLLKEYKSLTQFQAIELRINFIIYNRFEQHRYSFVQVDCLHL